LRLAIKHARGDGQDVAAAFLARLEECLAPALRIASAAAEVAPEEAIKALIEAAERLAASDEASGEIRLWGAEEGEALATHLASILAVLPGLPDQPMARLPALLDAVLAGQTVRTRRALRGRDGAEHPRVFIWGLLEARLQSAELIVLGGLTEGVWPPATEPGPWLSRRMRERIGLPSPEERVGQAAHDFVSAACAAPDVVLSCPRRRDGAPAVPARWLTRLDAFLAGQDMALAAHPAAQWARQLGQPADGPKPVAPPRPMPDVRLRPRRLSVTEIETWLRDPYAIYARHILRLRPLDPLDESADAARYGELAHDGLHRFLREHGTTWPADADVRLREAMHGTLLRAGLRDALRAWWTPRFTRIAAWVVETEIGRRSVAPPMALCTEIAGEHRFERPGGLFVLRGRADRIERRPDGKLVIIDYKTGTPPTQAQVTAGFASQLPLEAVMAAAGAFGPELAAEAGELVYWHLTGGFEPGVVKPLFRDDPAELAAGIAAAGEKLLALIDAFDDPMRCYLAQPHPGERPRFSDYAQLARVAEWAVADDAA
jgi:ATP-dependent helicase/nuclease subunit B